ncbi:hypothetical protein ACX348_002494 [Enterococcus hirae]
MKENQDIRNLIADKRLKHWEVALKVGISDSRFSIWLRTPLDAEKREKVLKEIEKL